MPTAAAAAPANRGYHKRRDYFIKKWLQARFIFYYLIVLVCSSGFLAYYVFDRARRELRVEMFRGHSTTFSTWNILKPDIIRANVVITLLVILAAALITLFISMMVLRASRKSIDNIRAYLDGQPLQGWPPVGPPRELQRVQSLLAEALETHRNRLESIQVMVAKTGSETLLTVEQLEKGEAASLHTRTRELHVNCEKIKHQLQGFELDVP